MRNWATGCFKALSLNEEPIPNPKYDFFREALSVWHSKKHSALGGPNMFPEKAVEQEAS